MKLELLINNVSVREVSMDGVTAMVEGTPAEIKEMVRELIRPTETLETKEPAKPKCFKENNIKNAAVKGQKRNTNYVTIKLDKNRLAPVKVIEIDINGNTYQVFTKNQDTFLRVLNAHSGQIDIVNYLNDIAIKEVRNGKVVKELDRLEKVFFMDELCEMRAVRAIVKY